MTHSRSAKVLWKYEHLILPANYQLLIAQLLQLLEQALDPDQPHMPYWTELQLSDFLPEHRPRTVVGGNYMARRPIAKLGRNDPCHCGSGKKYKKCCYFNDQELLRDASQYAGTTRSELRSRPGLVDDPAVIYNMRAHELKKLSPSQLSEDQLISGYQCALNFGLQELAFDMLVACQQRLSVSDFDRGHFEDLIERVLEAGDLALARKIRDHCGDDMWFRPHAIQFLFDLLENPDRFDPLEQECRKSVCGLEDEETIADEPLIRLAYECALHLPGLAIVFARAAIASNPDRMLDNDLLLGLVRDARVDLDLEPWSDPAQTLFDWIEDRTELKRKAQAENAEIKRLASRLAEARAALSDKKQVLREMEQRANDLGRKADRLHQPSPQEGAGKPDVETSDQRDREATLKRLRVQVASLKAEIGEQQDQRGRLRKMLEQERKKFSALSMQRAPGEQTDPDEQQEGTVTPSGKLTLPEYTDTFRKTCESLPPTRS